jgi:DNA invertase Pin-like site-specific DNA recombinase/uncharacterized Zn finger protein (UPF0148 family)
MEKAFIYCRVSTEEQAEKGYSLDAQAKYCRDFAVRNGYEVAGVYRDEGRSGTNLNRPALKDLLLRVQEDKSIKAIIIQETDRLARNTKDHLTVRALLRKAGVKLISVAQPMLDDSPEGNMIDTIIASVNQFQSDINSRKTKKGLQEKFDSGWWPGWAPLGYINKEVMGDQRITVPDPERWYLIRKGLKMYLRGNYSALEIADTLYEKGLKSKTEKKVCNSVMTNILRNPFYAGLMKWNGQEKIGNHKPMITLEEHEQILQIINTHNFSACRRRKHGFLLKGFVFCNICGGRYTAEKHPAKNNIAYYHCAFNGKRGKERPHTNKDQNVEVKELERQVREEFKKIQFSDDFIGLVIEKLKSTHRKQKRGVDAEKRILYNQKLAVERKRDLAEEKLLNGVISDKDFTRIRVRINEELSQIQHQLDELDSRRILDVDVIRGVLILTQDIHCAYKKAPYELKRQLLGLFWEKFFVQDRKIVEAISTKLVRVLLQERKVIIRSNWLPSPKLIITMQDWGYMRMMSEKLAEIKRFYRSSTIRGCAGVSA